MYLMIDDDDNDQDVEAVYSAVQGFSHALMGKMNSDPLVVAAVLASTALSIYKTTLPQKDFEAIVDAISDSRDSVKPMLDPSELDIVKTIH